MKYTKMTSEMCSFRLYYFLFWTRNRHVAIDQNEASFTCKFSFVMIASKMASDTHSTSDAHKMDPPDCLLQQIFVEICKETLKQVLSWYY